ncbi:MAG: inositol monophosphatase family protein [Burkholderia gladioli]
MTTQNPIPTLAGQLAAQAGTTAADGALLAATVTAVRAAGAAMLRHFDPQARTPDTLPGVVAAIHANDDISLAVLRPLLTQARPTARWVADELEGGALPDGEWWLVDPVEGNVNHVHGLAEWGVSATLIRDNVPVLTAIHEPVAGRLYTAVRDSGVAYVDGVPMRASAKTALDAAVVTTGQAKPGESEATHRRIGASVTAMLRRALVVRMTVPATFQLAQVASGQIDGFWQHSNVRSGQAAGALLIGEAGGVVTDLRGRPWTLASDDFLACAPGIHGECIDALRDVA